MEKREESCDIVGAINHNSQRRSAETPNVSFDIEENHEML
jgi:hypothetical protein